MNGWELLNCRYFARTCQEVVSEYLEVYGFSERELTNGGGIIYHRYDSFLEIDYDTSLSPQYYIIVSGGILGKLPDGRYVHNGVPFWYLLPEDHSYRIATSWASESKEELVRVLQYLRTELLETTMIPLLLDRDKLECAIAKFNSESNARRRRDECARAIEAMRREANIAWGTRDYKAIKRILEKHRSELTPSEKFKLDYACKKLQKSSDM